MSKLPCVSAPPGGCFELWGPGALVFPMLGGLQRIHKDLDVHVVFSAGDTHVEAGDLVHHTPVTASSRVVYDRDGSSKDRTLYLPILKTNWACDKLVGDFGFLGAP